MHHKHLYLLVAFVLAFALSSFVVTAQVPGCCSNPAIGAAQVCDDNTLVDINQCCPSKASTPGFYQPTPGTPIDENDCRENFFDTQCSALAGCTLGCCCSQQGPQSNIRALCTEQGAQFDPNDPSCSVATCDIPQCNDGLDNDCDGCADFAGVTPTNAAECLAANPLYTLVSAKDTGCASPSDASEAGGACENTQTTCNNPNHEPELSALTVTPVRGQKELTLSWTDECSANAVRYEIFRCEGENCADSVLASSLQVGTTFSTFFVDRSDSLRFDTTYTYIVKAHYAPQSSTPTVQAEGFVGNMECFSRSSFESFCVQPLTYSPLEDYLLREFPFEFKQETFLEDVKREQADKINKAFACNSQNVLVDKHNGNQCSEQQVCLIENNEGTCIDKNRCSIEDTGLFGLFSDRLACEAGKFCFFDRSATPVDACFSCSTAMSCYDYKSKDTCLRDNCGVDNCQWQDLSVELGTGVCVSAVQPNCEFCDKQGSPGLDNAQAHNDLFESCTALKAEKLSNTVQECVFTGSSAKSCDDLICADLEASACPTSAVNFRQDNTNRYVDRGVSCKANACRQFNGQCKKDSDADGVDDCADDQSCALDLFAPKTNITLSRGADNRLESLSIVLEDRLRASGSFGAITSGDFPSGYETFLCLSPCSQLSHPYTVSTDAQELLYHKPSGSDGSLLSFDTQTQQFNRLFTFAPGETTLFYYSVDPHKNVEEVNEITFNAPATSSGPIATVSIPGSSTLSGTIFASSLSNVKVVFVDPAILTFAQLQETNNPQNTLVVSTSNQAQSEFDLSFDGVADGSYILTIDAKTTDDVRMQTPLVLSIVLDSQAPTITINANELSRSPTLDITLVSDKEINLDSVFIGDHNITTNFTTDDFKTFSPQTIFSFDDGNYEIVVRATSLSGLQTTVSKSVVINARPLDIQFVNPPFGISAQQSFDVEISTDNDATCKFSIDQQLSVSAMDSFDQTGETTSHRISSFSLATQPEHDFFVHCDDGLFSVTKKLTIGVDTTAPRLVTAFAFPNPIQDLDNVTELIVQMNEQVVCGYTDQSISGSISDQEFDNLLLFKSNRQPITLTSFALSHRQNISEHTIGTTTYNVVCKNKAGLISSVAPIPLEVNHNLPVTITSQMDRLFTTNTIDLAVLTSKKATCFYDVTEPDTIARTPFLAQPSDPTLVHVAQNVNFATGSHSLFVTCKDPTSGDFTSLSIFNFTIDTDGPEIEFVDDTSTLEGFPEVTCLEDRLRLRTQAEDAVGIQSYLISLEKESTSTPVSPFSQTRPFIDARELNSNFREGEFFFISNLSLEDNTRYRFKVRAQDTLGQESVDTPNSISDGILIDTSLCVAENTCNDGKINGPGELCDEDTFSDQVDSCSRFTGFSEGNLRCTNSCQFDTSNCRRSGSCGDGTLDPGEQCEFAGATELFSTGSLCTQLSPTFSSGTLSCNPTTCRVDTSSCEAINSCGNGIIDPGETCDGDNFGNLPSQECTDVFFGLLEGQVTCSNCQLDTSACVGTTGIEQSPGFVNTCGVQPGFASPVLSPGESCEQVSSSDAFFESMNELLDCTSYYGDSFSAGSIICTDSCALDTSNCVPKTSTCGNGIIDPGETCDSGQFGLIKTTCSEYDSTFSSGELACDQSTCTIDTDSCVVDQTVTCGNGRLDTGELCDGSLFVENLSLSCTRYSEHFSNGTLSCNNCRLDSTGCGVGGVPQITCQDRGDCAEGATCDENADCASNFCSSGVCAVPGCADGIQNADETDIDCGGSCGACSDGRSCVADTDCASGLCDAFNTCSAQEASSCEDGILSSGEIGIDCGGVCDARCSEGASCFVQDDCEIGLECREGLCKLCAVNDADCDGVEDTSFVDEPVESGLPKDWLIANALDVNDPNIASKDADADGLDNGMEYQLSTSPINQDTDGDGATDFEEFEAGTDPLDPQSKPSSGILSMILLIIGLLVILGGLGYLLYTQYVKRQQDSTPLDFDSGFDDGPSVKSSPTTPSPPKKPVLLHPSPPPKPVGSVSPSIARALRNKHLREHIDRDKFFSSFDDKQNKDKRPQPVPKSTKIAPEPPKSSSTPNQRVVIRAKRPEPATDVSKPKPTGTKKKTPKKKKSKKDVFAQLEKISQDGSSSSKKDPIKQLKKLNKTKAKKKKSDS